MSHISFFIPFFLFFSSYLLLGEAFIPTTQPSVLLSSPSTKISLQDRASFTCSSSNQFQIHAENKPIHGIASSFSFSSKKKKRLISSPLYATEENTTTESKVNANTNASVSASTTFSDAVVEQQPEEQIQQRERPKYGIFNINTKGGVLIWGTFAIFAGLGLNYLLQTDLFGLDYNQAGLFVSTGVMGVSIIAWTASYLFRVVNKDMTYAQQLKDYEDAVLMKRLEELQDDEVEALLEEVDVEE